MTSPRREESPFFPLETPVPDTWTYQVDVTWERGTKVTDMALLPLMFATRGTRAWLHPSQREKLNRREKMSLREMSTAVRKREAARNPLQEAIDARNALIGNPKDEEGRFKEETVQVGFEILKEALDQYWAHIEVRDQLIVECRKRWMVRMWWWSSVY